MRRPRHAPSALPSATCQLPRRTASDAAGMSRIVLHCDMLPRPVCSGDVLHCRSCAASPCPDQPCRRACSAPGPRRRSVFTVVAADAPPSQRREAARRSVQRARQVPPRCLSQSALSSELNARANRRPPRRLGQSGGRREFKDISATRISRTSGCVGQTTHLSPGIDDKASLHFSSRNVARFPPFV